MKPIVWKQEEHKTFGYVDGKIAVSIDWSYVSPAEISEQAGEQAYRESQMNRVLPGYTPRHRHKNPYQSR